MNGEKQTQALLTLDPVRNRIRIHRQTIRLLGNPAYVQFLVNPEELYIAELLSSSVSFVCVTARAEPYRRRAIQLSGSSFLLYARVLSNVDN